jgi:hypothetical protein
LLDLIKKYNDLFGSNINYRPYNIKNTQFLYGAPPVPITGLQYVFAKHDYAQTKLVKCLTGKGIFVSNQSKSGLIELALMQGSPTCAGIQIVDFTGIPFPILITDLDSGGTSTVIASACRRVDTPEWRREAMPGLSIFTFATPRLLISDGLRLAA